MANLLSAGAQASGDLLIGLLIGAAAGFLIRPVVRSWLASREWVEASRRTRLTDEVLAHMDEASGETADTTDTPADRDRTGKPDLATGEDRPLASHRWQPRR